MPKIRRTRQWVLLVLAMVCVAGCRARRPLVEVVDVRVTGTSEDAVALDIRLNAHNSNSEALELREMRYTVYVDGTRVYTGRRSGEATLRAGHATELTVPAVVGRDQQGMDRSLIGALITCRITGSIGYLPPGRFARTLYDAHLYRPRADVSGSAEATLRGE